MFSDGRYLYVMSQHKSKYGSIKYYVDSYDPLAKMAHQRRVKLRYAESGTLMLCDNVLQQGTPRQLYCTLGSWKKHRFIRMDII